MPSEITPKNRYLIDILEVTDKIINFLTRTYRIPQNPSEISRGTGVTRSRVFRVIKSLQELGYVDAYKNGYTLGYKFLDIGEAIINEIDVYQKAKSVMGELASSTGEAVFMYVWTGNTAVCIARAVGANRLQVGKHIGEHIPLYIGAAPLVLLAYMPGIDRQGIIDDEKFIALTNRTINSIEELQHRITQTLQNGYDVDLEEYETGVCGIGVPIFDRGEIVGALSLETPSLRFTQESRASLINQIVKAANHISTMYNKMTYKTQISP